MPKDASNLAHESVESLLIEVAKIDRRAGQGHRHLASRLRNAIDARIAIRTVIAHANGYAQGWTHALDKFDDLLAAKAAHGDGVCGDWPAPCNHDPAHVRPSDV
jgi:hypothetical protein